MGALVGAEKISQVNVRVRTSRRTLLHSEFLPCRYEVFSLILSCVLSSSCHIFLDNDSSDSELPSIMFKAHSRAGILQERRLTQDIIPMKSLPRGGKPSHFSYQRNTSQEEHDGRGRREALRPKPLFHAVDEEFESGEESGEETSAVRSRWSGEHRPTRQHHRSHSPLLQRK